MGNRACSAGRSKPDSDSSVSTESDGGTDLYVTLSGSNGNIGLYKFGKNRVSPPNKYKGAATPGKMPPLP